MISLAIRVGPFSLKGNYDNAETGFILVLVRMQIEIWHTTYCTHLCQLLAVQILLLTQEDLRKEQRTDPLWTKTKTASPKKNSFFMFSGSKKIFCEKILTLFYATFQCGRYNLKKNIFCHENIEKLIFLWLVVLVTG